MLQEKDENELLSRHEMLESEFQATMRITNRGSGRIHVPPNIAKNYLQGQLVKVRISGTVGPVVIL